MPNLTINSIVTGFTAFSGFTSMPYGGGKDIHILRQTANDSVDPNNHIYSADLSELIWVTLKSQFHFHLFQNQCVLKPFVYNLDIKLLL